MALVLHWAVIAGSSQGVRTVAPSAEFATRQVRITRQAHPCALEAHSISYTHIKCRVHMVGTPDLFSERSWIRSLYQTCG